MKRFLPPAFLALFVLLGGFLLVESTMVSSPENEPFRFQQSSKNAIFKINTPEMLGPILQHGLVIEAQDPDAVTLVKIEGHHGPFPLSKIQSNGEVYIVNPDGVLVDADSQIMPRKKLNNTLSNSPQLEKGNVYALAIQEGGSIQASRPFFRNGNSFLIPILGEEEN